MKQSALIVFLLIIGFSVNGFGQTIITCDKIRSFEIKEITPIILSPESNLKLRNANYIDAIYIIDDDFSSPSYSIMSEGYGIIEFKQGTDYIGTLPYNVFSWIYCTTFIGFTRDIYDASIKEELTCFNPFLYRYVSIPNYKPANEE